MAGRPLARRDEAAPGPAARPRIGPHARNVPAVRLGSKILDTMLDAWDKDALRQHVPEGKEDRYICRIGTKGVGSLEFEMTDRAQWPRSSTPVTAPWRSSWSGGSNIWRAGSVSDRSVRGVLRSLTFPAR